MSACFITAGPIEWGSSRLRAWWVAPHMEGASVIQLRDIRDIADVQGHDAYVFQKTADLQLMNSLKQCTSLVFWDTCDPSHWWQPELCRTIADVADGIVASNEALADDFSEWYGSAEKVHTIPDRLELSHFDKQREHTDVSPVRLIWFGIAVNRIALYSMIASLERLRANRHDIALTIMDDRPDMPFVGHNYSFPITYVKWQLDREVEILARHDIALLPPYPGPWGMVKSDNKVATAFACGLPALSGWDYQLLRGYVMSASERQQHGTLPRSWLERKYDIKRSAAEWQELITRYSNGSADDTANEL